MKAKSTGYKKMNKVFNSTLELSLRILMTLYTSSTFLNEDEIVLSDFITVYSNEFGSRMQNLHGNNEFSFSEFAARREQFHSSIKELVINNYITVNTGNNGFTYQITLLGESVCDNMSTDYASVYMDNAYWAHDYMKDKSTTELFSYINQMALISDDQGVE